MDVLNDNSFRQWYMIADRLGRTQLPDYVRHYTPPTKEAASALSDDLFALPGRREYPLDCPAATWLSAMYCTLTEPVKVAGAESQAVAMTRILQAADAWGIRGDVNSSLARLTAVEKRAAADDDFAWIIKDAQGQIVSRRYPIYDAVGVRKAATFFAENRNAYPRDVRTHIATRIMEKASAFGVAVDTLPGEVLREAGYGLPQRPALMDELNERAHLAKDAEAGALLANVNRLLAVATPDELVKNLDKVADIIDKFDRSQGLVAEYGKRITPPADFLAGMSVKEAQAFVGGAVKLRRLVFDTTKLATAFEPRVFETVLGPDLVKQAMSAPRDPVFGYKPEARLLPMKLAEMLRKLSPEAKGALEDHLVGICAH